jgi:hypothetical protein
MTRARETVKTREGEGGVPGSDPSIVATGDNDDIHAATALGPRLPSRCSSMEPTSSDLVASRVCDGSNPTSVKSRAEAHLWPARGIRP